MSKFEVLTAMAFAAFADAPVDVAVIEVGLGGRWDATNVINAPVAVITPISVDHVEYLGADIAGIAGEKAGIIHKAADGSPDTVAVIARQVPEAMEVLLAQSVRADAAVAREDSEFAVLGRQVAIGGQLLQLQGLGGVYSDIYLPLHGEHQAHNAVVALAAVEAFFGAGAQRQLDVDAVRAGFAAVISPGRLERMRSAPTVFIDAAHNPAGAAALAQTLAGEFDFQTLVGVISVMADKDIDGILAALEPVFDSVVVTHNGSPRALDVESLALAAGERFGPDRVITAENLRDAIDAATALVDDAAWQKPAGRTVKPLGKVRCFPARGSSSPVRSPRPGPPAPCSDVIRNDPGTSPSACPFGSLEELQRGHGRDVDAGGGRGAAGNTGGRRGWRRADCGVAGLSDRAGRAADPAYRAAAPALGDLGELGSTSGGARRLCAVPGRGIHRFAVHRSVGPDRLSPVRSPGTRAVGTRAFAAGLS